MTRKTEDELTPQENLFIDALFEHNGNVNKAKQIAGFKAGTNAYLIRDRLTDVIIARAEKLLAVQAPRAVNKMTEVMEDPSILGASNQLAAAKEVLDRIGITKKERLAVTVDTPNAVLVLPPKSAGE
jgi:hypothetical protein